MIFRVQKSSGEMYLGSTNDKRRGLIRSRRRGLRLKKSRLIGHGSARSEVGEKPSTIASTVQCPPPRIYY
jgi:hypothetical protein